jgi:hypothetical protein
MRHKRASGVGALNTWNRWERARDVMVMMKKESEGSHVAPLILDASTSKDSYSR